MPVAPVRHDSQACKAQVWISFLAAASPWAIGLAYLPGRALRRLAILLTLAGSLGTTAQAHPGPSDASALSMLPIAVSVAAPVALLSAGSVLTVVSVEASAVGSLWVLERASDGVRASLQLAGHAVTGLSVAAGTAVVVTAISTGWVLSSAGEAIAFVPNGIGTALLHNERITR